MSRTPEPHPISPDPVTNPAAYQRTLIDLVGPDDPVEVQQATPAELHRIVDEAGFKIRERPAPNEWSVLELIGHLADAELVASARYRWAVAQDRPPLMGYDQDLWVDRLRHNEDMAAELLTYFESLRLANLNLWQRLSPEERKRVGMHAERGPESVELMFRLMAGHDRFHLTQIRTTLDLVRG